MPCKYNDCGWCYAPEGLETNAEQGACRMMQTCPQSVELPPIHQPVLTSAYNFYSEQSSNNAGDDSEEHW